MTFNWNPFRKRRIGFNDETETNIQNNPNYSQFSRINQDIQTIVNQRSVINRGVVNQNKMYANPSWQTYFDGEILAMPLATNKAERIDQYRRIASYGLCDWCFDEIADDFLHEDEDGKTIKLHLPDRLNAFQQDILQNEFERYMENFKLKENGYNIIKRFLTEGELAWENVISQKHPEMGIIGVRFLPAEFYETLVDIRTAQPIGIVFDTEHYAQTLRTQYQNMFQSAAQVFNAIFPTTYQYSAPNKQTSVPMLYNQITYINSGEYSHDFMISYPLIEKAKQDYYKLALLEDSAVILRVTHAPERLLFNVSTGKMTQNYADEYVRCFANQLKSKKVASPDGKDVSGVYSPITQLESYVFGKSDGNDGTSVESVGSSASYDQMDDIEYFLRKFLKNFKIPWSRYKTPENTIEKNESMTYEEYTFSRMIIRFQRRFAEGFKRGFITNLKLKQLWDKETYELHESDIQIDFVKPVLYDKYELHKATEIKMNIYKLFVDNDEFSKIIAMKKYLDMSDKEIDENYRMRIKEQQYNAIAELFHDKISEDNPPVDFKSPFKLKSDVEAEDKAGGIKTPEGSSSEGEESGDQGGEAADDSMDELEEEPEDEGPAKSAEEPSFGLG